MTNRPSAAALLNRRIAEFLNEEDAKAGRSPDWTPELVRRVLRATSEATLDAVSNGEEVQMGQLGRFLPVVTSGRTVSTNCGPRKGLRVEVPSKVTLGFQATPFAASKVAALAGFADRISEPGAGA